MIAVVTMKKVSCRFIPQEKNKKLQNCTGRNDWLGIIADYRGFLLIS